MTTTCPFCQYTGKDSEFGFWARPEPAALYVPVLRCPTCRRWYAVKEEAPQTDPKTDP